MKINKKLSLENCILIKNFLPYKYLLFWISDIKYTFKIITSAIFNKIKAFSQKNGVPIFLDNISERVRFGICKMWM